MKAFIQYLNNCYPSIKFTAEISDSEVNFLDTTVHLDPDGSIWTDLYSKHTDSHIYLRFESSHPRHCMQGIPYSQFLRVRRICTREEDFIRHCENLRTHFIRRGYPTRLLDSAIARAGDNHCKDLLNPHNETVTPQDEAERRLFAVTTYQPTQRQWGNISPKPGVKQASMMSSCTS